MAHRAGSRNKAWRACRLIALWSRDFVTRFAYFEALKVNTMKSIWKYLASMSAAALLWLASAGINLAHAVNDLPGGPAVNQLNLYPQ